MKKTVLVTLIMALFLLSMAGCTTATTTTEATTAQTTQATTEATPETTAMETEATEPETTESDVEKVMGTGVFFELRENNTIYCTDVPEPGMTFPISSEPGMFQVTVYALDADGNKLGDIDVAEGLIDYSEYADQAVTIVVENAASSDYTEYVIGSGIFFEAREDYTLYCTDVPEPGMTFPISSEPGMFQVTVYALDADGNRLGEIDVAEGLIDYSEYADSAVKIIVEGGAAVDYAEYDIPMA